MSRIKEELDELFLDPKEKWFQYLENVNNKFGEIDTEKDFITVTIFSPLHPEIMTDLILETKNVYGLESRLAEYAISGFGFDRMYKDIQEYNIMWQTSLIKNIKRKFSSQKVINTKPPFLNIQKIKDVSSNKIKIYTHLEKRQYGMTRDLSKGLNCTLGDLSLIYHIFTFNHAFYKNDFSELYELYTKKDGLINDIKKMMYLFDIESDSYIRKIYPYCREELEIENYRNEKGYRNSGENVFAQRQAIKEIEFYMSDIPNPVPNL